MNNNFYGRLALVAEDAVTAICEYDGEKIITLPTGEKAIDHGNEWLVITNDGVMVRSKELPGLDEDILDLWDYERICSFADELLSI